MATAPVPFVDKVQKRKILILGKTGCGKSTIANKIIDQERFQVSSSLQSMTAEVQDKTNVVKIDDKSYEICVMDTIGFFDTKEKKKRFNNSVMIKIIKN